MKRFFHPSLLLIAAALLVGIVIGCNFDTQPERNARAAAAPPSPEEYVEQIQDDVEQVDKSVEQMEQSGAFDNAPREILVAAACEAYDLPLETYRYVKEADPNP